MPKGELFAAQVLDLAYLGRVPAWISQREFYLALHAGAITASSGQADNETRYPGYERLACARDGSTFERSEDTVENVVRLELPFAAKGAAEETATHWSLGTRATGPGQVVYFGALETPLRIRPLHAPVFLPGELKTTER